jgi:phosphatidylserine/phosphatidylglycerophosphate/cardiolipin synthase-like enzyme
MKEDNSEIEFVITVPEEISAELCIKTNARQTISVLIDIFLKAKKYVILSSPFLQDFVIVNRNLELAVQAALKREVKLIIISTGKSLKGLDVNRYGKNVKLYRPITNDYNNKELGSHAKFCSADGEVVYIGSANMTMPGMGKHIEMGIFGKKELAKKVELFWDTLSKRGFLTEVKGNQDI